MSLLKAYFPVSIETKAAILTKYNKSESDVAKDVVILKEWLKKQPQIPDIKDDDVFLEICLLRNKFRMEKTKLKMDRYFACKHLYSNIFKSLDPSDINIEKVVSCAYSAAMPKLAPCYSRILFTMLNITSEEDFNLSAMLRLFTIGLENLMIFDYIDSMIFIVNGAGVPLSSLAKIDFSFLATLAKIYKDSFSSRVVAIHILNMAQIAEFLLSLARPFIPSKIKDKIIFHSKSDDIFNYLPKDCLPREIGGTAPAAKQLGREQYEILISERDYILQRNRTGTLEHLRIGNPLVELDSFGNQGTFRKIEFD